MSTLSWIVTASLAGSLLSLIAATLVAYLAKPHWVPKLVSFAVGALLAAVFLEILPHALGGAHGEHGEHAHDPALVSMTLLAGILLFFVLEKLVIWRHCHSEHCEEHTPHGHEHGHSHSHDHGRSGLMVIIGDTFHNFLDGAVIAAAFMADTSIGIATAMAIIAHEIPQEVGDCIVLLHSGYSKARALFYNTLSSLAALLGGLIAYYSLSAIEALEPYLLALGASSLIYVAIADLIPGLHKRPHIKDTVQQILLIGAGVGLIALTHHLFPH